ncbi:SusC/RagA family TonB-linked outer membrane protein [Pedobacter jeongneungensis]|uniref:SusC/RagA family TonB-linked outer membrane protein n=1 Tax=Pedobacter jeongneungensis TaxID=947309 RepID=UPI0004699866|nr:SusC/RagA family TonB-linked outer membrane protein [Pedobacter jeongneungensis]
MKFYTCFRYAFGKKRKRTCTGFTGTQPETKSRYPIAIIMRTNLVVFFLALFCLKTSASVYGQNITLSVKNAPLEKVLSLIEKQSGYLFWYEKDILKDAKPVDLSLNNSTLTQAMDACLKDQDLIYVLKGKTIVVKVKVQSRKSNRNNEKAFPITGQVQNEKGQPIPAVTVRLKGTDQVTITDKDGRFQIEVPDGSVVLQFSYVGYANLEQQVGSNTTLLITLKEGQAQLEEVSVVSTGYQTLPKERATGSFVQLDNTLLNRRISTNILERIDGIAPGVYFNGQGSSVLRSSAASSRNPGLNIRGRSTILAGTDPLIVLDNFPYEGEISNINPNDIESITILKDAAAASIWGARAGNGVIVITTKKGKLNQKMQVELNTNVTIGNKPDLFYDKNYLSAPEYIEVEKILFNAGFFNADITNTTAQTPVSPVIDILTQQRSGAITSTEAERQLDLLKNIDVRNDYEKYVYQKSVNQQYSLGLRGGTKEFTYAVSIGKDDNRSNEVRNGFNRTTINIFNTYRPIKNLEITGGLNYSINNILNNNLANRYGSDYGIGGKYQNIYPYAQFAGPDGNALPIVKGFKPSYLQTTLQQGFLDWNYRPLDEIKNGNNTTKITDVLFKVGAKYQIIPQLSTEINYQNEKETIKNTDFRSKDTYYTRDLINRYSQYTPSSNTFNYIFPVGDILTIGNSELSTYNLRAQLNYNQTIKDHQVNALAGAEIREVSSEGISRTSYGYNDQFGTAVTNLNYNTSYAVNPSGTNMITSPDGSVSGATLRYLSHFANVGYSYKSRYTLNLSGRKDGSNIFGANTNDKITPLWSTGLGWDISKEHFYKVAWLPYLKLRATYGFNGNVYNGSAYLTGTYTTALITGARRLAITTAPNPELRWEKVENLNLGLDFSAFQNRISGSLELFKKEGKDLLQRTPLAPQTGFTNFTSNAAATRTLGYDLTLQSQNIRGHFSWSSTLLLSGITDKLLRYDVLQTSSTMQTGLGIVGKSLFSLFSYQWAGLDPTSGDPQGYLNGKVSKDYAGIIRNFNPDSLKYNGSYRPGMFGSLRNDFYYKGFGLSLNISYKLNYYFRKPSTTLNYQDVLGSNASSDFSQRWKQPGDELITSVPSLVYPNNSNRNTFYQFSDALVEKGDHIRLQDVRLSYDFTSSVLKSKVIRALQLYAYANNIGIIWRANKEGIDPDKIGSNVTHTLPNPFTIAFGVNTNF